MTLVNIDPHVIWLRKMHVPLMETFVGRSTWVPAPCEVYTIYLSSVQKACSSQLYLTGHSKQNCFDLAELELDMQNKTCLSEMQPLIFNNMYQ